MPERTLTAARPGPVVLDLSADAVALDVVVSRSTTTATLSLSGPAEAIEAATHAMEAAVWGVALPEQPAGHGIRTTRGGGTFIQASHVSGNMSIIGNRVFVDGTEVTNTGPQVEPVRATVVLPAGSALRTRVQAGTVGAHGLPLEWVTHDGVAADLHIDTARTLTARTKSGSVRAAKAGSIDVETVSGDITIDHATGTAVRLRTVSGDIHAEGRAPVDAEAVSGDVYLNTHADVDVTAAAVSGDVTVMATSGACPRVRATSVSGRVRTPIRPTRV
ncbi:putative adhesin [Murinocardiopsis flavida]|uniref:Putative adhesin n=1 Tax=Murinocardiopsis flavida TaxID=645275 RepID=A0A2P8DFR7_9ACTN|nr:DUF4097 family beta strand repeat-containing protein [Murinocardiopsis flavida]PSK96046.1 putative adhesin [Murinocardiopsis flavida]